MRVLITGAGGFAGQHLLHHLIAQYPDAELYGTVYSKASPVALPNGVESVAIDLLDQDDVRQMLSAVRPDSIYHLAAQSSPSRALQSVWPTFETNVRAQLNIIEGCIALNLRPRILITSSGEVYRTSADQTEPIKENCELYPSSPYALSKITQDMMGWQYFLSHQFPIIRVRPFNHTGPGQASSFVAPDFALQIARIEIGQQEPVMFVGNLEAQRDFTDVRDVVRAYALLMQSGEPGQAYNVASGKAYSIQHLLDTLLGLSQVDIDVQVDPDKLRPVDVPIKRGDYSRLHEISGWEPTIQLEATLSDLLADCRERVQAITRSS